MENCKGCNKDIYGDADICPECKSEKLTPKCRYYTEVEKKVTVPYCKFHDKEIMGMSPLMKCRECEDEEG